MKIYKLVLLNSVNIVQMEYDSVVVSVGLQNDQPVVWFTSNDITSRYDRTFLVVCTGEDFDPIGVEHRGTVQRTDGIVLHILEKA